MQSLLYWRQLPRRPSASPNSLHASGNMLPKVTIGSPRYMQALMEYSAPALELTLRDDSLTYASKNFKTVITVNMCCKEDFPSIY
jgi:hypothetical protein